MIVKSWLVLCVAPLKSTHTRTGLLFSIIVVLSPLICGSECNSNNSNSLWLSVCVCRGVDTLSRLPDILAYFHHSCPAPHILCIQFSFNLPDIH